MECQQLSQEIDELLHEIQQNNFEDYSSEELTTFANRTRFFMQILVDEMETFRNFLKTFKEKKNYVE